MLEVTTNFINEILPAENFLVFGESYGGYITLGLLSVMPDRIDGAALLCPGVTCANENYPQNQVIWKSKKFTSSNDDPDINTFLEIAVIANPEIYNQYQSNILPGVLIANHDFLTNYFEQTLNPELYKSLEITPFDKPVCIITGRQDHIVGYSDAYKLIDVFPRATYAVLDCAGHILQIENVLLLINW